MYKLAIFDLDGTLFNTLSDICGALDYVFIKNSITTLSFQEAEILMGDGLKSFLDKACQLKGVSTCPDHVIQEFIDYYGKNCCKLTSFYDGVLSLLDKLTANNVKLTVLSNKSEILVKKILKEFKIYDKFLTISGGDTFAEKKPSSLPVLETLRILNIQPSDAIMIGDSENDMVSGSSAGVATCYCTYGYGKQLKTLPNFTVDSPDEIFGIVMGLL